MRYVTHLIIFLMLSWGVITCWTVIKKRLNFVYQGNSPIIIIIIIIISAIERLL